MRHETSLKYTYKTNQIGIMNETLKWLTGELTIKVIERTQFTIQFNPFGGYYNLFITCYSIKDSNTIRNQIEYYMNTYVRY